MLKTGLKTFACSFVFSLSAIVAVNKAVSHDISSDENIKIPHNNISLFLKDFDATQSRKNGGVKKIALIKQEESTIESDKSFEIASRPLPEIIIQQEEITEDKTEKASPPKAPQSVPDAFVPIAQKSSVSKTLSKEIKNSRPQKIANKELVMAEAKPKIAKAKETLLIPLQKENITAPSAKIAINPKVASRQVAMLNLDKPIKSVVKEAENKKNVIAENATNKAEIIGWQSMSQKKGENNTGRTPNNKYEVTQVEVIEKPSEVLDDGSDADKTSEVENKQDNIDEDSAKDNKWIAAKGTKFPVNQNVLEQEYYKQAQDNDKITAVLSGEPIDKNKETKVAGEVVQNILIPIPEDIINNKELTPKLTSDPDSKSLEEEISRKENAVNEDDGGEIPFFVENKEETAQETEQVQSNEGLLSSISSLFTKTDKESGANETEIINSSKKNEKKITKNKILPTEIRLSFQPNRAEISGNTLNWIQAFALKTKENEYSVLEIRLDGTSSFELQQKRLNLLYNILTNLGLEYKKVDTVFTNREPNSFVLRVVNKGDNKEDFMSPVRAMYYKKW